MGSLLYSAMNKLGFCIVLSVSLWLISFIGWTFRFKVNMLKAFSLCELSLIWKHFIALDHAWSCWGEFSDDSNNEVMINWSFVFPSPFHHLISSCYLTGELKKLKTLVINAKEHGIKVVPALVKRMLEKNMFLFGFVDLHEGSVSETGNQLTELQDARVQVAYKKYVF